MNGAGPTAQCLASLVPPSSLPPATLGAAAVHERWGTHGPCHGIDGTSHQEPGPTKITRRPGPPLRAVSNPASGGGAPFSVPRLPFASSSSRRRRRVRHSIPLPCNREQRPAISERGRARCRGRPQSPFPSRRGTAQPQPVSHPRTASERALVTRGSRRRQRHPPAVLLPPKSSLLPSPPHPRVTTENSNPTTSVVGPASCAPII